MCNTISTAALGAGGEYIVLGELSFAGIPAIKMPDSWQDYDITAYPTQVTPETISVKAANPGAQFINVYVGAQFDWIAFVLCYPDSPRRIFVVPYGVAMALAKRDKGVGPTYYWAHHRIAGYFADYENNFSLRRDVIAATV